MSFFNLKLLYGFLLYEDFLLVSKYWGILNIDLITLLFIFIFLFLIVFLVINYNTDRFKFKVLRQVSLGINLLFLKLFSIVDTCTVITNNNNFILHKAPKQASDLNILINDSWNKCIKDAAWDVWNLCQSNYYDWYVRMHILNLQEKLNLEIKHEDLIYWSEFTHNSFWYATKCGFCLVIIFIIIKKITK